MTTPPSKDTIYIDIDDEITAIIEKVIGSDSKIVALVLPKRATTLQSVVNMKLLKRSADESKKNLVLVTTEPSLMPLAGSVGLHVAKTPQSKPEIPSEPAAIESDIETVDEDEATDFDSRSHAATPIGALSGTAADNDDGPIDFDNEEPVVSAAAAKPKKKAGKSPNKLKVPNFTKFRKRLLIGAAVLVLLLGGLIYALVALPNATIAISTNTDTIDNTLDVTFDATAEEVNSEEVIIPSIVERLERTNSETVAASGERNDGDRAEGTVVMEIRVCSFTSPQDIPAGTGVTSEGKTYITQESADFSPVGPQNNCFIWRSNSVEIVAQEGGARYNVKDADFTVAGSTATAEGSAEDGTDDIVKVVSQEDVDSANQKLNSAADASAQSELERRLEDRGLYVIKESFSAGEPESSANVPVGSESAEVTVTRKTIYTMIGADRDQIESLITQIVEEDIDTERQSVLETGLDDAVFQLQNQQDNGARVLMSLDITSVAGPELNEESLKELVAGKKSAEAESLIAGNPGVTEVEVTYGPFWVTSIPSNVNKITITYNN